MSTFGITPEAVAAIVSVWRREAEEIGALSPPAAPAARSATCEALARCVPAAGAATGALGTTLHALADALARFNALTTESDERAGTELLTTAEPVPAP